MKKYETTVTAYHECPMETFGTHEGSTNHTDDNTNIMFVDWSQSTNITKFIQLTRRTLWWWFKPFAQGAMSKVTKAAVEGMLWDRIVGVYTPTEEENIQMLPDVHTFMQDYDLYVINSNLIPTALLELYKECNSAYIDGTTDYPTTRDLMRLDLEDLLAKLSECVGQERTVLHSITKNRCGNEVAYVMVEK